MKTTYLVFEYVDVESDFGSSMPNTVPLATFTDKAKAKEYIHKYSDPKTYDPDPYCPLYCGKLGLKTIVNNPTIPARKLPHYLDTKDLPHI